MRVGGKAIVSTMSTLASMLSVLISALYTPIIRAHSAALLSPDVMSFHAYPQLTFLYSPVHRTLIREVGLPAPQGTDFEGPDPGLNAAIITVPEVCPNNYMKDIGGRCRPAFTYGPNPLSTFSPEEYKGSIQFYMGLRIGQHPPARRRNFLRPRNGRLKNRSKNKGFRARTSTPAPNSSGPDAVASLILPNGELPSSSTGEAQPGEAPAANAPVPNNVSPLLESLLPVPPELTEPVAEITAILAAINGDHQSSGDNSPVDDDDD